MNARAKRLRAAAGDCGDVSDTLLNAIAVMLDAATRPEPKVAAVAGEGAGKLAFSPAQLLAAIRARAGHVIITEPLDKRWFGRMGGVLKNIVGLEEADLDRVLDWIVAGGLRTWPNGAPDLGSVARWFPEWIGRARTWEDRGRQEMRGANQVGAPVESDPGATWDAFKAKG